MLSRNINLTIIKTILQQNLNIYNNTPYIYQNKN